MLKKITGVVLFLLGLWLLLPISLYGRGYWSYFLEIAKGIGPLFLIVMGILIIYMEMSHKKKR